MAAEPNTPDGNPPRLHRRIWASVFRGPVLPRSDRERKWITSNNVFLHFRPMRLPAETLRFTHTFGLGGMCVVLFLLLAGTGILLVFVYQPTPEAAYESILWLQESTLFGSFVRGVHHWSANLLILLAVLHMLRVFFTGAFHPPRQFNWVLGLGLLAGVVAANFTGYLLPWNQLSYWAITISTGMLGYVPLFGDWLRHTVRGGGDLGQPTLTLFYALHTTVVPIGILALMGFHFWRVRKAGGVVIPRRPRDPGDPQPEKVLGLPFLFLRELVVGLVLAASVLLISALVPAPLGGAANPGMSPNPAKAPWYFMGFQELLLHLHPAVAVSLLPILGGLALIMVPYLPYDQDTSGIWFVSERGRRWAARAGGTSLAATPLLLLVDEWRGNLPPGSQWIPPFVSNGLLPLLGLTLAGYFGYRWLRLGLAATKGEAVQTVFVFFAVAFLVLTAVGIWLRGPGMALVWTP
jgi:quinol-cytochrome oxidoreductase complex cytochrome b subunit